MEPYCTNLYNRLQNEMADLKNSSLPCCKKIEGGFQLAVTCWVELAGKLRHHRFASGESEIRFFRSLKPMITAEIEYYHFRYHALLFEPEDIMHRGHFWNREYGRLERFRDENKAFIRCYEDEQHEGQAWYFLRKNYNAENAAEGRLYDSDAALSANGDWLTATLLALERHKGYVRERLESL